MMVLKRIIILLKAIFISILLFSIPIWPIYILLWVATGKNYWFILFDKLGDLFDYDL